MSMFYLSFPDVQQLQQSFPHVQNSTNSHLTPSPVAPAPSTATTATLINLQPPTPQGPTPGYPQGYTQPGMTQSQSAQGLQQHQMAQSNIPQSLSQQGIAQGKMAPQGQAQTNMATSYNPGQQHSQVNKQAHDDFVKWKHFPRYWPFVWGIHRSPVNSPHKGQWRRALMFSLICAWINGWVNNLEAGDLRCHLAHYDCNKEILMT